MPGPRQFATTRWSLVLQAGDREDPHCRAALGELLSRYWYPLYVYLRRVGHDEDAALDSVQGFAARLLERGDLQADAEKGKFRSYLIGALKNFVAADARGARTAKRGGDETILSLDTADAEVRYRREPATEETPEKLFERRWALEVLRTALHRLRTESEERGRMELFAALEPALVPGATVPDHAVTATRLGTTEGAVKVALHRMRQRLGELIRDEVVQTLPGVQGVEDEVGLLLEALG